MTEHLGLNTTQTSKQPDKAAISTDDVTVTSGIMFGLVQVKKAYMSGSIINIID